MKSLLVLYVVLIFSCKSTKEAPEQDKTIPDTNEKTFSCRDTQGFIKNTCVDYKGKEEDCSLKELGLHGLISRDKTCSDFPEVDSSKYCENEKDGTRIYSMAGKSIITLGSTVTLESICNPGKIKTDLSKLELLQSKITSKELENNVSEITDPAEKKSLIQKLKNKLDNTWWKDTNDPRYIWYHLFFVGDQMKVDYLLGEGIEGETYEIHEYFDAKKLLKYNKLNDNDIIFIDIGRVTISYYEKKDKVVVHWDYPTVNKRTEKTLVPFDLRTRARTKQYITSKELENNVSEITDPAEKKSLIQKLKNKLDNTWWKDTNDPRYIWYHLFFVGDQMEVDYLLGKGIEGETYATHEYFVNAGIKLLKYNKLNDNDIIFINIGRVTISYYEKKDKVVVHWDYPTVNKRTEENKVPSNLKNRARTP